MAKAKIQCEMLSYGIHSKWDADSKALPKIKQFTTDIPAQVDIEFGFIVNLKKAKGKKLRYCIYHPGILDKKGREMAPFDGEEYVRTNDWDFYLGDTIWLPLEDKFGHWHMTIEIDGDVIAEKTFDVVHDAPLDSLYWTKR